MMCCCYLLGVDKNSIYAHKNVRYAKDVGRHVTGVKSGKTWVVFARQTWGRP